MAFDDDDVRQGYLLHALATEPAKALPAGKSLLSVLTRPPPAPASSRLEAHVSEIVHKAFWDEALLTLSSPIPAIQLPRLGLLYRDLHHALAPLFPASHPLLLTLSAPIPPTSSPLHSAHALLKDILLALRRRCSPMRDPAVDQLLAPLLASAPPFHSGLPTPLASLLIDTFKSLVALADTLKNDLAQSLLGSMSDSQLADFVKHQARTRERELILDVDGKMWGTDLLAEPIKQDVYRIRIERLGRQWRDWVGAGEGPVSRQHNIHPWISRLMEALTAQVPVSCHPFDQSSNALPPQFFFCHPSLLYVQNYLQALVICASLRSLLKLNPDVASDFTPRVWNLLEAEIDKDEYSMRSAQRDDARETQTTVLNLADEAIRAQRSLRNPLTDAEERKLRAAVERTLRLTDPVFILLQGRLKQAITARIHTIQIKVAHTARDVSTLEKLRTGRGNLSSKEHTSGSMKHCHQEAICVKGFEDVILAREIGRVVQKLLISIQWIESLWGDEI